MNKITVVTVARSDFSILQPVMKLIKADPDLELHIIAAGMHLAPQFGMTVNALLDEGFAVDDTVEMLLASDSPEGTVKSIGLGMIGFAQIFAKQKPDILVITGDRFEMFSAAAASLPFGIKVAHIHGGELSEGAIDDALRHCVTKLSHVHFTSTERYRRRVIQLGESPDNVIVSGAPALDNLKGIELLERPELEDRYGIDLSVPPILVTFHPTTLNLERTKIDTEALIDALEKIGKPVIFTAPNADAGGALITKTIKARIGQHNDWRFVTNFGFQGYFSILSHAEVMVGNSSSGIIEAASFDLPVVNIGIRQAGRITGKNVIHVDPDVDSITNGLLLACSKDFRSSLTNMQNPYGSGQAASIIVERLKLAVNLPNPIIKSFYDLEIKF